MKASFGDSFSEDLRRTSYFFLGFAIVGLLVEGLSATSRSELATLLLWSFACSLSGALIGFLFGIPKIMQEGGDAESKEIISQKYRQQVNTNLEQISDWLTKIIVGVGLIQLSHLPSYLNTITDLLRAGLGREENHKAFALALIVYFTILGFLFGYLSTRLFLAGAFSRADQSGEAAIKGVKDLARQLSPDLLKQVLIEAKPEKLIEGEETFLGDEPDKVSSQSSAPDEEPEVVQEDKDTFSKTLAALPQNVTRITR